MWIKAPNIICVHGFSTRHGGVSAGMFSSLNLGGTQDEPERILENRQRALSGLNLLPSGLCTLKQVHGNQVVQAKPGIQEGDALVTNQKQLTLAISIADCYPILFHDPLNQVIGAAHAGWRGTLDKIAEATVQSMINHGARAENIQVAIGQGISQNRFEVGNDVIDRFNQAGFPEACWHKNKLDLIACNVFVLLKNGILKPNIWTMNRCSFEHDFFSYRRDKSITGRMWAVISIS